MCLIQCLRPSWSASPSQAWNCLRSHWKESPVSKAGVCCWFWTAPVATGYRRRGQRDHASKFPPLNAIRKMSSHQFYHHTRGAVRLTRPLATSWHRAAIDRSRSRVFCGGGVGTCRDSSRFQIHKTTTDGSSCFINLNENCSFTWQHFVLKHDNGVSSRLKKRPNFFIFVFLFVVCLLWICKMKTAALGGLCHATLAPLPLARLHLCCCLNEN